VADVAAVGASFAVVAALSLSATASAHSEDVAIQVASLAGSVTESQTTHEGPGEDGTGESSVTLRSSNRPRGVLRSNGQPLKLAVATNATGDAHAEFVFVDRVSGQVGRRADCASRLQLARTTRVTAMWHRGNPRLLDLAVTLPFVGAPFVEATDLYPETGPCGITTGATVHWLQLEKSVRASPSDSRYLVSFSGTRRTAAGDTTYTTRWSVKIVLRS